MLDPAEFIQSEHVHGSPTDSRNADDVMVNPAEMLGPNVVPRMEQPGEFVGFGIEPRDISPFEEIAIDAGQTEVFCDSSTAMLAGNDVLDFESENRIGLCELALFTA